MEKKNNLSLGERLMFVDTVINFSKAGGKYEPALYDYAFRMATVIYFTDIDVSTMDQGEMEEVAFSKDVTDMMREVPRKYILDTLNKACREKIAMEREAEITAYNNALRNEPWNKVVNLISEVAKEFGEQFTSENLVKAILAEQNAQPSAQVEE